jgi:hypothetical protein
MSGRVSSLAGKRRAKTKAPGKKPNAHRQRELAKRRKQYRSSALFRLREEAKAAAKADAAASEADKAE